MFVSSHHPDHSRDMRADQSRVLRGSKGVVLALLSIVLVTSLLSGTSNARRSGHYRGRSRRSSAISRAYRAQAIQNIRAQVSLARSVLANAESQAAMSQATVSNSISQLSGIREQIEGAHDDVAQAAKTLHELEKDILDEQTPDSELKIAETVLQQAKNSMHAALHRVFNIPHKSGESNESARLIEFESLSNEQKEILEKDPGYQIAQRDLQTAAAQVAQRRREVFLADKEWVEARQALAEADRHSRKGTQQATTAGMSLFGGQQKLHSSQQLAASARSIIAFGEARLRQLGAKSGSSSSSSKHKKKR
jgi:hypothetical protein